MEEHRGLKVWGMRGGKGRMRQDRGSRTRVSTEVTFWHSAEYGSDFRCNSGEIPRNFAEFRRNCTEITSEVKKFRGIPCRRNSVDTLSRTLGINAVSRIRNPDPSFHYDKHPDRTYHFDADPDPYSNLRPLVYRPSTTPFWSSRPPL